MNLKKVCLMIMSICILTLSLATAPIYAQLRLNAGEDDVIDDFYPDSEALLSNMQTDRGYIMEHFDPDTYFSNFFGDAIFNADNLSLEASYNEWMNYTFYDYYECETVGELEAKLPEIIAEMEYYYEMDIPADATLDDLIRIELQQYFSDCTVTFEDDATYQEMFYAGTVASIEQEFGIDLPADVSYEDAVIEGIRQQLLKYSDIELPEDATLEEICNAYIIAELENMFDLDMPEDVDTVEEAFYFYLTEDLKSQYGIILPEDTSSQDTYIYYFLIMYADQINVNIPESEDFDVFYRELLENMYKKLANTDAEESMPDEELFQLVMEKAYQSEENTFYPLYPEWDLHVYGIYEGKLNLTLNAINPDDSVTVDGNQITGGQPFEVTFTEGTKTIEIVVENADGIKNTYKLNIIALSNSSSALTKIKLGNFDGNIDEASKTITVNVPYGTDVSSLLTSIDLPKGASASLSGNVDFTSPVKLIITAENGTKSEYTINVVAANPPTQQPTEKPATQKPENPTQKPSDSGNGNVPTGDPAGMSQIAVLAVSGAALLLRKKIK